MPTPAEHQSIDSYLLELHAHDPFSAVRDASEAHRVEHAKTLAPPGEQTCDVYPSDPLKARLLSTLARALQPRRILEIGGGLGYSALWLLQGAGPDASIDTVDRFSEHVSITRRYAQTFGFRDRLAAIEGEAGAVLQTLAGAYDFVHDDGWFGRQPDYFDPMLALLRPGGTLAISNWFLIEQAIVAEPNMDWSPVAGPNWRDDIRAYAQNLISRPDLDVSFISRPWLAIAIKRS